MSNPTLQSFYPGVFLIISYWSSLYSFKVGVKRKTYTLIPDAIMTKSSLPMKVGTIRIAEHPATIANNKTNKIFIFNGMPLLSK